MFFCSVRRYGAGVAAAAGALLTGCAQIPDVTLAYRPVTWSIGTSVVHTVTCTQDLKQSFIATGATFTPVYEADLEATPYRLPLKELNRFFSDAELSASFTDDGRLKTINQSSVGQGETITKALVGTVVALNAAGAVKAVPLSSLWGNARGTLGGPPGVAPERTESLCQVVKRLSGIDPAKALPQISLVQTLLLTPDNTMPVGVFSGLIDVPGPRVKTPAADLAEALKRNGTNTDVRFHYERPPTTGGSGAQPAEPNVDSAPSVLPLEIQQTTTLTLVALRAGMVDLKSGFGGASLIVPLKETIKLPIPKPALFGKQAFDLSLADSGRITKFGYTRTAGAAGALSAAGSIAGEKVQALTAEAAALKAASDLIVQQNRNSACTLSATSCE